MQNQIVIAFSLFLLLLFSRNFFFALSLSCVLRSAKQSTYKLLSGYIMCWLWSSFKPHINHRDQDQRIHSVDTQQHPYFRCHFIVILCWNIRKVKEEKPKCASVMRHAIKTTQVLYVMKKERLLRWATKYFEFNYMRVKGVSILLHTCSKWNS